MKKIGGIIGIIVILIIILLILGLGLGFGKGKGEGDGNIDTQSSSISEDKTEEDEEETKDPNQVNVVILEDEVIIDDKRFDNPDDLQEFLEDINTDQKVYTLDDTKALQSTYEWAMEVFDRLKIVFSED